MSTLNYLCESLHNPSTTTQLLGAFSTTRLIAHCASLPNCETFSNTKGEGTLVHNSFHSRVHESKRIIYSKKGSFKFEVHKKKIELFN